mmetsp:Transcript_23184/g.69439  ORF Transcript_23184/g.69439 Transcript_23184/m.69439 type:complete len:226 (-) Transcript_23184:1154-1831(-)
MVARPIFLMPAARWRMMTPLPVTIMTSSSSAHAVAAATRSVGLRNFMPTTPSAPRFMGLMSATLTRLPYPSRVMTSSSSSSGRTTSSSASSSPARRPMALTPREPRPVGLRPESSAGYRATLPSAEMVTTESAAVQRRAHLTSSPGSILMAMRPRAERPRKALRGVFFTAPSLVASTRNMSSGASSVSSAMSASTVTSGRTGSTEATGDPLAWRPASGTLKARTA